MTEETKLSPQQGRAVELLDDRTWAEAAEKMGGGRSTFEEHVERAVAKRERAREEIELWENTIAFLDEHGR